MALIDCQFFSETLGMNTAATVILPQATTGQIGLAGESGSGPHPTLWLLHGLSDDHTIWVRRTAVERYVAPMGLAVVMPNVHRSFYADMVHGGRYFTFLTEELPRVCRSFFPLSAEREGNFLCGLSMGGYGAFRVALTHPDRYTAAASLSGALDRSTTTEHDFNIDAALRLAFGDPSKMRGSEHDLLKLASDLVAGDRRRPALYQCCGTADFLYDQNQSFLRHARGVGLDVLYEEHDGFGHTWDYWDRQLRRVLGWLPIESEPAE